MSDQPSAKIATVAVEAVRDSALNRLELMARLYENQPRELLTAEHVSVMLRRLQRQIHEDTGEFIKIIQQKVD